MSELVLPLGAVEPYVFGLLLVLLRVTGILLGLPVLSNRAVPGAFRAVLLMWLSGLVFISIGAPSVPVQFDLILAAPLFATEFLTGAAIGFAARLLFAVAEVAGAFMGVSSGLAMARAFDPMTGQSSNIIGQIMTTFVMLLFITIGGHYAMLGAAIDSFERFPIGEPQLLMGLISNLLDTAEVMFALAFRLSAPVIITALVVNASMGLLVRMAPQLNLFAVGFLVVIGAGLMMLYYEVPTIGVQFQDAMVDLRSNLVEGGFAY